MTLSVPSVDASVAVAYNSTSKKLELTFSEHAWFQSHGILTTFGPQNGTLVTKYFSSSDIASANRVIQLSPPGGFDALTASTNFVYSYAYAYDASNLFGTATMGDYL